MSVFTNMAPGVASQEGTWTPYLFGSTVAGTHTYTSQTGVYTVIGKRVFATFVLVLSALDGAATGQTRIGGLPFASKPGSIYHSVHISHVGGLGLQAGNTQFSGDIGSGVSYMRILGLGTAPGVIPITNATSTFNIRAVAIYETA